MTAGVDPAPVPVTPFTASGVAPASALTLVAESLSRSFSRRPILADLTFRVDSAEVLVVTGPNGSGKSTLLRLLAGLLRPTRGRVWIERAGAPLSEADRRSITGYAAPDVRPYEELTATENLELLGRIRGVPRGELRIEARLESVGLDPRGREPSGALSTGQRQRLKLALAGLGEPRLMILDEPGANLDQAGRSLVARLIQAARANGPVVLATNDPEEAQLGDRELRLEPLAEPHVRRL